MHHFMYLVRYRHHCAGNIKGQFVNHCGAVPGQFDAVRHIIAILVGGPALIYAVHEFYMPLDLVAENTMNRLGVRW